MKTLARTGAVVSFTLFLVPGIIFLALSKDGRDSCLSPIAVILGLCLLGIAVFSGTILWLAGEKCFSKKDTN